MHAPSLRVLLRHSEGPGVELPELMALTTVRYNRELRTAPLPPRRDGSDAGAGQGPELRGTLVDSQLDSSGCRSG